MWRQGTALLFCSIVASNNGSGCGGGGSSQTTSTTAPPATPAVSPPALTIYEQLIADVYPIQQNRGVLANTDAVPDEVVAIQSAAPVKTNNWENLRIGEFEPEAVFKQRQAEAQSQETKEYKQAVFHWKVELAVAEAHRSARLAVRALIAGGDLPPKLVAHAPEKPLGELEEASGHLMLALPTYDRTLLGFDRVSLPGDSKEITYQGNAGIVGQFNWLPVELRIRIKDLSVAQKFKEDVAAGRVAFQIWFEPWLTEIESPIITKPAHDDREIDKGEVAKTVIEDLLVVVIAHAAGADPDTAKQAAENAGDDAAQREYMKTVYFAAETREGVRFHFKFDPVRVAVSDDSGKPLDGVDVEMIGHNKLSVRFSSFREPTQEGARVLKPGDEILSIAGKNLDNVDALTEVDKAQPAGSRFTVCFRSVADGHEHEFTATGGRPLGIDYMEIFPGTGN